MTFSERVKRKFSSAYTKTAIAALDLLVTSAKKCKKDTTFDNLRSIIQEGDIKPNK